MNFSIRSRWYVSLAAIAGSLLGPHLAHAQESASTLDSGDTAWILVSTALVLFMTIPGLALFYGGLVQTRNVLSVLMQCLVITSVVTVVWVVVGYSLAFDTTDMVKDEVNLRSFVGGLSKALFKGVDAQAMSGTIPEVLFAAFQLTFAIITPALIVGTFAERMKFSALLWFSVLWLLAVYLPICHMTWSGEGGLYYDWGVFDFAGGTGCLKEYFGCTRQNLILSIFMLTNPLGLSNPHELQFKNS